MSARFNQWTIKDATAKGPPWGAPWPEAKCEEWLCSTLGFRSPRWDQRPFPTCRLCDGECNCPWGHNANPITNNGPCCDDCNARYVDTARRLVFQAEAAKEAEAKARVDERRAREEAECRLTTRQAQAHRKAEAKARKVLGKVAKARAQAEAEHAALTLLASRECVATALIKMPVMVEALARDVERRKQADASFAQVKALNAAAFSRAEESKAKAASARSKEKTRTKHWALDKEAKRAEDNVKRAEASSKKEEERAVRSRNAV